MWAGLFAAIPTILALIQRLVEWAMARDLLAKGKLLAIAEASKALNSALAKAAAAEQEAAARAARDSTDGAFDKEDFRDGL